MELGKEREGGMSRFTAEERDSIARFVQQVVDSGYLSFFVEYCTPDPETPGDCVVMWDGPRGSEGWSVHKAGRGKFAVLDSNGKRVIVWRKLQYALEEAMNRELVQDR